MRTSQISRVRVFALAILVMLGAQQHAAVAADALEEFKSPQQVLARISQIDDDDNRKDAIKLLRLAVIKFPSDANLKSRLANKLFENRQSGDAEEQLMASARLREDKADQALLEQIAQLHAKWARSERSAVVMMQQEVDAGNLKTAVAVGKIAAQNFPMKETILVEYGRALMISGSLAEAEKQLRKALTLDPLNTEARKIIEEIRATEEAQTSTELAEWISIAKDKVGDFIVTFLALFTAFLVNSLMAPIALRYKLNRARKAFEQNKYDDFTDLMEGLLDTENFSPLRANLRELIQRRSYEEAQVILNKYVNTLERLPTLLRILERENEKLHEST